MQRKIHNKTLFVAALSVYLGLLIVGAPPQVLAQPAISIKITKSEVDEAKQKKLIEFRDKFFELLNSNKFDDVDVIFQADVVETSLKNTKISVVRGDAEIAKLLQQISEELVVSYLNQAPTKISQLKWELRGTKADLNSSLALKFNSEFNAEKHASAYNLGLNFASKQQENKIQSGLLKHFFIEHENDQVFIVTRLPRAALDSLLKADEKAN